jgi:hypothetical protein
MNVRAIDLEKEYDTLCRWWACRGLLPPPKVILSAADGFAVHEGELDLVIGWIYMTHKGVAGIVEWTTSNPIWNQSERVKTAIELLYDFLAKHAKENGCTLLFSSTQEKGSLAKLLKRHDWLACQSEPHVHLIKQL